MRKGIKTVRLCALMLLVLLCWGLALHQAQWLQTEYTGVSVRMQSGGLQKDALAKLAQNDDTLLRLSAWSSSEGVIQNEGLATTANAKVIAVYGSMADVCPMQVLYGTLPVAADESGCVIDESTAQALYRQVDAVGAALTAQGKRLIVRAVVRAREPMLLLRQEDAVYQNLEFVFADVQRAGEVAKSLLYGSGVEQGYTLVESGFYATLAEPFAALPAFLVAGAIVLYVLLQAFKRRGIPLQLVLLLMLLAALPPALNGLLDLRGVWPSRFLPTQWADLDFWPELIREQTAYFNELAFLTPVPKEMQWRAASQSLLFCTTAAVGGMLCLLCRAQEPPRVLDTTPLWLAVGCMVVSTGILHLLGATFTPTGGYLYALPVWWLFRNRFALSNALAAWLRERRARRTLRIQA